MDYRWTIDGLSYDKNGTYKGGTWEAQRFYLCRKIFPKILVVLGKMFTFALE